MICVMAAEEHVSCSCAIWRLAASTFIAILSATRQPRMLELLHL